MTTSVGGLIADIGLNVAMLRADVGKANAELSRGTALMNRSLGGLQRQVGQVSAAFRLLVGAAGLGLLARGVRNVVNEVDGLAKAAKTADVTAESLQELRFAFGQIADVTDEQVDLSLQRFTQRLGDAATGNKALAASFASLGVALSDTGGRARSTEAVLEDTLAALGKIENDAVRAAMASDVFGDNIGPKLAQALRGGTTELDRMRRAAHDLGIVLSDELVASAEQTADQFDVLGRVIGTGFQKLVLDNVKTVQSLADAFMNLANWAFAGAEKIVDFTRAMGEIAGGAMGFGVEADTLEVKINTLKRLRGVLASGNLSRSGIGGEMMKRFGTTRLTQSQIEDWRREIDAEVSRLQQDQLNIMTSGRNTARGSPIVPRITLFGGGSDDQSLSPELRVFIDKLERAEKIEQSMRTEVEKQVEEWLEAKALFDEGLLSAETLRRLDEELLQPIKVTAKRMPKILDDMRSQWDSFAQSLGMGLQDTLVGAMLGIETNFRDMLKRMAVQMAVSGIFDALGGMFKAGSFGANFFGGARAEGGPVSRGRGYLVGERGPELFMPGVSGQIIPGGGGGVVVNIVQNNDNRGSSGDDVRAAMAVSGARLKQEIKAEISDLMRRGRFAT